MFNEISKPTGGYPATYISEIESAYELGHFITSYQIQERGTCLLLTKMKDMSRILF